MKRGDPLKVQFARNVRGLFVPARPGPSRPVVAWAIPLEEMVYATWFMTYLTLESAPGDAVIPTEGAFIDAARNKLVEQFLTTPAEYLYFLDSDTCPPPDVVDRLLAHRLPLVGGWYRTKKKNDAVRPLGPGERQRITVYDYDQVDRGMHFYNAVREAPEDAAAPECAMGCGRRHAPRVEKHDALATGSMLIRRDVFTRLVDEGIVKPGRWFSVEEGGTEDLYFCRQVAKLGIDVCVDWSVHCAHIGLFKM